MSSSVHEFSHLPRRKSDDATGPKRRKARASGEPPTVGVIYNPRSHRNKGQDLHSDVSPHVFIAQPGDRAQLPDALKRFAQDGIDLLVINGGDGTVRDVLTSGAGIFKDDWPEIAVLPKGKTNALAVDLEAPTDWPLGKAISAFDAGRRIRRAPLMVRSLDQADSAPVLGFILGAGAFTLGIEAGQGAHKLGAFNSLAVGVTTVWGMLQGLFGSRENRWRRGVAMDIRLEPGGAELAHSGLGDPARRQMLFASTLERFPAGLKPFGTLRKGLKLAVLDPVSRRLTAMLPLIALGWSPRRMRERGFHQLAANAFTMELDEPFILDGEAFPPGRYEITTGPELSFIAP